MAAGKRGDRRLCLVFANSVAYTSSNVIFHLRFIGIHHAFPTVSHKKYMPMRHKLSQNLQCGAFHSTQISGHFGLVRPEYWGPALKVNLFDLSGHFGRSDRNVPFHLTKLLSPVPVCGILLTRTITKRSVAWFGSLRPECTVPSGKRNFRNFKPEFLLNGKRPATTL